MHQLRVSHLVIDCILVHLSVPPPDIQEQLTVPGRQTLNATQAPSWYEPKLVAMNGAFPSDLACHTRTHVG